jgi:hypothetical protein
MGTYQPISNERKVCYRDAVNAAKKKQKETKRNKKKHELPGKNRSKMW